MELNRLFLKEGLLSELLSERDVVYGLDWGCRSAKKLVIT